MATLNILMKQIRFIFFHFFFVGIKKTFSPLSVTGKENIGL
jgi:hypothetical protein